MVCAPYGKSWTVTHTHRSDHPYAALLEKDAVGEGGVALTGW